MTLPRFLALEPANTTVSSAVKLDKIAFNSSNWAGSTFGPLPLISVSWSALILTLIRVSSATWTKRDSISSSARVSVINLPVKPPINPVAVFGISKRFKTRLTLIPFPPANLSSLSIRLTLPTWTWSKRTI